MFAKNNKIDALQIFTLMVMIGNALFVGMGNIITVQTVMEDTWLVGPVAMIIGIIPILLMSKIMNYEPDLNLIEKIKNLFGSKLGFLINLILVIIVSTVFIMSIWGLSSFANTKYLTETPMLFIVFLFMIPVFYANSKGIETIARISLILVYMALVFHFIITISLLEFSSFYNVKPILANGLWPVIIGAVRYLSYSITPMITLLIIPKNKLKNSKKSTLALLLGYIFATFIMSIVFYMDISTVGAKLASMYMFPEYFIMKKISLGNALNNVENFFSIVWINNMIICAMMTLYYLSEFFVNLFKVKLKTTKNLIILGISVIVIIMASFIFQGDSSAIFFMKHHFPIFIGLPLLIVIIIIFLVCLFKSKNKHGKLSQN